MPILDALRDWLTAQRRRLSSKNALARAMQYALSRWEALTRYAGDGRLAIDNNVAERALRTIAITRKNFLFLGSEAGGERAAILYTVLESAKLNGLDPRGVPRRRDRPHDQGPPDQPARGTAPLELASTGCQMAA